jgi:hypothetical protein
MSTALIQLDSEGAPALLQEAEQLKQEVIGTLALVGLVETPEQNQNAVAAMAKAKAFEKAVDKAHAEAKEPYLKICQQLDKLKRDILKEGMADYGRVYDLSCEYNAALVAKQREEEEARQRELKRIEDERLAEERRIAEANRLAEEARQAAARMAQEAALAEQRRLEQEAANAKSKKAKEEALARAAEAQKRQNEIDALAAKARAERADQAEKERLEREIAAEKAREAIGPAVEMQKTQGQAVKAVWVFDVVDIHALARARADLVDIKPKTALINDAISLGVRDIPGIKIYEAVKSSVRAGAIRGKTIDV